MRSGRDLSDATGSAPVEFVLVGLLLTLTLGVLHRAAVYVRNAHDAPSRSLLHGALADTEPADGAAFHDAAHQRRGGRGVGCPCQRRGDRRCAAGPEVQVTVVATFPARGLLGIPSGMEG
ncbi:MAG: TadE family protein [Microbacterium sp.]